MMFETLKRNTRMLTPLGFILLPLLLPGPGLQAGQPLRLDEADLIPHIGERGREAYLQFFLASSHRAFAIAPGGAWAWTSEHPTREAAERAALEKCRGASRQKCVLYAADDDRVFDTGVWPTLWGPYRSEELADQASVGTDLGERFPNLQFKSESGRALRLSDFRGKVVVLHFWGSWCPHCCREMPDLQRLSNALGDEERIEVVMLQVRESFGQSKAWSRKLESPVRLYDSGVSDIEDTALSLDDGTKIEDRVLAEAFPATYILDGNGIVVFSRTGAIKRWHEYLSFLRDTARHTAGRPEHRMGEISSASAERG